jgi:hypothetical protein
MSGFVGVMASHKLSTLPITTMTLQNNGVVSSSVGNPFGSGNAYYFPATTGTYMAAPSDGKYNYGTIANPKTNFGTGNFTVEWFEYQTTSNNWPRRIWMGTSPSWGFDIEGSTPYWWTATSTTSFSTVTLTNNSWTHWAIVRNGTTVTLYQNGTAIGSNSLSSNYTDVSNPIYLGGKPSPGYNGEQFIGYMTSIRVCTTAVYTGNFTKPTSSLSKTQGANPYGGSNTAAITGNQCLILLQP